jgi:RNA-directed DNA polymerase
MSKRFRRNLMSQTKPKAFSIDRKLVMEAYKKVKANQGNAGIDGETLQEFENNYKDHLYKLWNRMSSGSYMPPPVKMVEIPKKGGGKRPLGIPTVSDRIAQTVVKMMLEPILELIFHEDSYGYRPGKSAIEALTTTRKRCWTYDWVIDLDIRSFF